MKTAHYVLLLFSAIIFCQCKPSQQILRLLNEEHKILDWKRYNSKVRKLLVSELSPDAWKNDTIIILEKFKHDPTPAYLSCIYESRGKKVKWFCGIEKKIGAYEVIDSLAYVGNDTYYVQMILNNQLDEFKRLGETYKVIPIQEFIAYILTKEKGKRKFAIQTLKTYYFHKEDPYDRIWYEKVRGKKMPER